MVIFLIVRGVAVGVFYLHSHSLPERMAHRHSKVQMEIVAVLCLIALFTHQNIFWIAGLLLAMVQIPDWSSPIVSIAQSLEKTLRTTAFKKDGRGAGKSASVPGGDERPSSAGTDEA